MELINGNPNGKHMLELTHQMMADYKAKYPNGELDMEEGDVNEYGHVCGTVHCAGGWDAVLLCNLSNSLGFLDGAIKYSKSIGFNGMCSFEIWAGDNRIIWGNTHGASMFSAPWAYVSEKRPEGAKSYLDVLEHRIEVAKRLIELQNPA